ncbi:MAG: efflux RND transporter periplasmic adaptor subunit [candidate division Zixibacteria bacterium]|nr:efflux RND transporter periplasmic adaptor subunit [candidate division Zixibacteria bacterium]
MSDSNARNADLNGLTIDRSGKNKPPGRWKRWFHLLWILLPIAIYFFYQTGLQKITPALSVRTATVYMLTGTESASELVATGYVVAQIKAAVASKATGRLKVLNVEEGDVVEKDQVLAELFNEDIKARLDIARANLRISQADSVAAYLNYERQKKLLASGHTTVEILEVATATYEKAKASVEAMKASLKAAKVDLDYTIISAPFDGTVLSKNADVGEMVTPFASSASSKGAVVTLADMSSLEVEADVSESNIQKVKINAPCEIILDAYQTVKYSGFVKKIVPTADRARATIQVKIAFDNLDNRIFPEMSARVNFLPISAEQSETEEFKPVMVVEHAAITSRDNQKVVFAVEGDYSKMIPVTIGRRLADVTEILSGLTVGQKVILSPPGGMKTGDKVEISQ